MADYRERLVRGLYNGLLNNRLAERAEEADPPFIGATSTRGTLARTRSLYLLRAGPGRAPKSGPSRRCSPNRSVPVATASRRANWNGPG